MNRKRWIVFLTAAVFALIAANCSLAGADPSAYKRESPYEYYVYPPAGYSVDAQWPVFVFIHGEGGSGLDCWNTFQKYADEEGFLLVCPSLADAGGGWYQRDGETKLAAVLNQVFSEYSVNRRIFLAGFSAGGQFVQGFAFHYSASVAGVAVIAPGNVYPPVSGAYTQPFSIMVGDQDDPQIIAGAQQLASNLAQSGYNVQYFEFPGVGHRLDGQEIDRTLQFYRSLFPRAA